MLNDAAKMSARLGRPIVLNVVTSSCTVRAMQGQLEYLRDKGFDVMVISPAGKQLDQAARIEGVRTIELAMTRKIAPLSDLLTLWHLCCIMRTLRPTITNVGTPKAGLLAGLAAWLSRVPCRFYTLRGLRFETTKGLMRRILVAADRLSCRFAHRVICVSKSVRDKAIASGLTSQERAVVFGSGSSNGVDVSHFEPTPEITRRTSELRSELGIPSQARVVGFVGRLTCDKGIPELAEAFLRLSDEFPNLRLLLLGPFEDEDPLPVETRRCLQTHRRVICRGLIDDPAPYYPLMDVLVLPSHREGLPNVVLEAQAAGIPVVAARVTGNVDAVVHGKTGLLFSVGDVAALTEAVARLISDKALAGKLAHAGRDRIKHEFRQEQVWEALHREYLRLLRNRGLPLPMISRRERVADLMVGCNE
jgi:glycosyltransferase involved in cell wall biosynthesis